MTREWTRASLKMLSAVVALAFMATAASAQSVVFSGTVTATGGQPIGGASVGIIDRKSVV